MLIQTTQDILFVVLSVSIVVLTGMLAYVLYYTGQTIKSVYFISNEVEEKVIEVSEMIDLFKERFMGIATIVADIVDAVKRVSSRRSKK